MKELTAWLERQATLERRSPCLEDAFLRDRFLPYALYRLRFFLARCALNWSLHAVGVLLLFGLFSRREFGAIALGHLAAGCAASFWWGGLEEMRGRIRQLYRSRRPHLIPREIGRWLSLSLRIAAGLLLGAAGWVGWRLTFQTTPFGPADLYLLSILLRLALEIPCRCYHSGIYAVRRIYRPFPAMIAVDLVGFVGLIALWPALGRWSFPVASLLSSTLVTAVGLHYTRRAYRLIGFEPLQYLDWPSLPGMRGIHHGRRQSKLTKQRPAARSWSEAAAAGLASAIMNLDAVLALVIFVAGANRNEAASLFVLFFTVSPAIRSGYEWAQLFYFDLKRLEAAPFGNLSAWLGKRVFLLGWAIGPVFWAAASVAAALVLRRPIGELAWPLLPFFHSRSLLAAVQVRAFAEGAYGRLTANGLLSLAGYLTAGLFLNDAKALLGLAAVNYLAVLLLSRQKSGCHLLARWREPIAPTAWLKEVSAIGAPVRISALRFCPGAWDGSSQVDRQQAQSKVRGLAREIARRLGRGHAVTVMHPGRVVWYEIAQGQTRAPLPWVVTRGAGLFELVGVTEVQPGGPNALWEARERGFFGDDLRRTLPAKTRPTPTRVQAAFRELFPEGIVWTPGSPADALKHFSPKETRAVLSDASAFASDFYPNGRRSGFEVTAFCDGNDLQLVFVVQRGAHLKARLHWRSVIRRINLDGVMSPAASAPVTGEVVNTMAFHQMVQPVG